MADVNGSGVGIGATQVTPGEEVILTHVPEGASADDAALNAQIDRIAGGHMGVNLNDPRYVQKGAASDTTATGTEGGDGTARTDASGDGPGSGAGSGETTDEQKATEAAAEAARVEAAAAEAKRVEQAARDKSTQQGDAPVAKDYSLTIKGADTVDAEGKIIPGKDYKIEKIEDLPEDFQPRYNRQILEIISTLNDLNTARAKDEAKAAADAEASAASAAEAEAKTEMLTSWDAEIAVLQKAGEIPEPKLKPTDPNYLKDPALVQVAAVFDYMEKTNKERTTAGNPNLLRSFADAFEKMDRATLKAARDKAAKDEADTAKLKAGVVGGGSAKGGTGNTAPVYVAGQAAGEIRNAL